MATPSLTGPDFSKNDGLLPVVAQDAQTGDVLMLAWMNAEAYAETVRTGRAVYYSRSRGKLWRKGEESGHVQTVRAIYIDCDADTILLKVDQLGAACHEGYRSCFFREVTAGGVKVVNERMVEPEKVYKNIVNVRMIPVKTEYHLHYSSPSAPIPRIPAAETSLFGRTCLALGYFSILILAFAGGIPSYATIPLILMGIAGLMLLALIAGVYWSIPDPKRRRQVNLLTIFLFTAACAMLLGTVTGLIRAGGRLGPTMTMAEWVMAFVVAVVLLFFSFPFAGYLAEAFIWSAVGLIRVPKVRTIVRRLMP